MTSTPKLPPARYQFLLNPHAELRLSRCPTCKKMSYPRKFAFFIDVQGWGPMVQGKTCQYCPRCEMILCHQLDLETELALSFAKIAPHLIGRDYFVAGVVDLKVFKAQLKTPTPTAEPLKHFTPFKTQMNLDYDPGGWSRVDAPPRIITAAQARERLSTPWKKRG